MTYSHILWDFNGTILNDVEAGIKSANVLLSRRHMKMLDSVESYHKLFCFPIVQYYKNLGLNMDKEAFNDLAVEWMEQYKQFSKESKPYADTVKVISLLKERHIPQLIVSATEKSMLINQLNELGLLSYFTELLALDDIYANSKVNIAKEWMKRTNPQKAVMIGDTVHDYEVSKEIGSDCILIANGHQSRITLNRCGVPVLDSASELITKEYIRSI